MEIRENRVREDPGDDDAERELALCCDKIGDLLFAQGRVEEAQAFYEWGMDYRKPQAYKQPQNAMIQRNLAQSRMNLTKVYSAQGNHDEALRQCQDAFQTYEEFARQDRETFSCQWDLLRCRVALV